MQLSTRHEFAFLCNPKCASTSIEASISKYCNINYSGNPQIKHMNYLDFQNSFLPHYQTLLPESKLVTFCIMRDPFDWMKSWYNYRSREKLKNAQSENKKNYTGNISFEEFVIAYMLDEKPPYADIPSQFEFMRNAGGMIGLDHVFSMQHLDKFYKFISKKFEVKIPMQKLNISSKRDYLLSSKVKNQFLEFLNDDFTSYQFINEVGHYKKRLHYKKLKELLKN